jgi:hypothetical protein
VIHLKRSPTWLIVLLVLSAIYAVGFPLNQFVTDRRNFSEYPIVKRNQSFEQLLSLKSPDGLYDYQSVIRGSTVVQISFSTKEVELKRFLKSIEAQSNIDIPDIRSKMEFWGCGSPFNCPIPWWNSTVTKDNSYSSLHNSVLYYITAAQTKNTDSRVNLLAIKQRSP